jgi:MFS family permease
MTDGRSVSGADTAMDARAAAEGLFAPGRRELTVGLVLTVTIVASESLAVGTVMPIVAEELGDLHLYGWAFSAFFLGSLVGIVVAGGLLDRGGLRGPLAVGLGLFTVGLLLGGLAPSMPVLVAARLLQGLGAGAVPPVAYVAIGRSLPETLRPRMFAVLSTAWVIPGVLGPSVAGLVVQVASWRWIFLGLLPLVVVAGTVTLGALRSVPPAPPSEHDAARSNVGRIPLAIAVAIGAGVTLAGLTATGALGLAAIGVGVLILGPTFRALSPPGTLRLARGVPAAIALRGVLTFAFFGADVYVPYLLVQARGLEAWTGGLAFTAATLTWTGGSWIQARLAARFGTRAFVGFGFGLLAVGVAITMSVVFVGVPWPVAVVGWSIAGLAMGLSYSPLSLAVLRDAPVTEQGSASAALQLSDVLGTALGTGVAGAIVAAAERTVAADGGPSGPVLGDLSGAAIGIVAAFGLSIVVAVAGWIATRRLSSRPTAPATASSTT